MEHDAIQALGCGCVLSRASMSVMVRVDVSVSDVPAAVAFYARAFGGTASPIDSSGACDVDLGSAILRVTDQATHSPGSADRRYYEKGRVPRLELQVDDVGLWVGRATAAGATVRSSVPSTTAEAAISYAHVVDPFGHLWALALAGAER